MIPLKPFFAAPLGQQRKIERYAIQLLLSGLLKQDEADSPPQALSGWPTNWKVTALGRNRPYSTTA